MKRREFLQRCNPVWHLGSTLDVDGDSDSASNDKDSVWNSIDIRWDNTLAVLLTGFITYGFAHAYAYLGFTLMWLFLVLEFDVFGELWTGELYFSKRIEAALWSVGILLFVVFDSISTWYAFSSVMEQHTVIEENYVFESLLLGLNGAEHMSAVPLSDYFFIHLVLLLLVAPLVIAIHYVNPRYRQFIAFELFLIGGFIFYNNGFELLLYLI